MFDEWIENLPEEWQWVVGIAFFVLVVFLVCGLPVLKRLRQRRRAQELEAQADILGFSFEAAPDGAILDVFDSFDLFDRKDKKIFNLLQKRMSKGVEALLFDYHFGREGRYSTVTEQTVASFRVQSSSLPRFELHPEMAIVDWIAEKLGARDIDFPEHAEFSRKCALRGKDEEAVRNLFRATVLDHFADNNEFCIEGEGERLIMYRRKLEEPRSYSDFLDRCTRNLVVLTGAE